MEPITNKWQRQIEGSFDLENALKKLFSKPEIADFIRHHDISSYALERSYSKLFEYATEKENFEKGLKKDYEPVLIENEGFIDVAYRPTKRLLERQELREKRQRIQLIGMPKGLREIRWTDVRLDDINRQSLFEQLSNFIAGSEQKQGLYVYGDFGVGKTFMLAAMANEMAEKGKTVALIHYPTFVLDLTFDNVKEKVSEVKAADLLVLDDIGGEMNNAWLRDSVLQVILQHRMQENLPTFFSSNLAMTELEQHLAETKSTEDAWAAKRVMERIRYLAKEVKLQGENRRHD